MNLSYLEIEFHIIFFTIPNPYFQISEIYVQISEIHFQSSENRIPGKLSEIRISDYGNMD